MLPVQAIWRLNNADFNFSDDALENLFQYKISIRNNVVGNFRFCSLLVPVILRHHDYILVKSTNANKGDNLRHKRALRSQNTPHNCHVSHGSCLCVEQTHV